MGADTEWLDEALDIAIPRRVHRDYRRMMASECGDVRGGNEFWWVTFRLAPVEKSALAWQQRRLDWSSNVRRRKRRMELERRRTRR